MQITPRYVRKNRRIYNFSLCKACGSAGGTAGLCGATTCLACNTTQCMSNGLGCGQCSVCYVGILPGWSGSDQTCAYKHCDKKAVARLGNVRKPVCKEHLEYKQAGYVEQRVSERDKSWFICEAV
jgi:hypothetical protein